MISLGLLNICWGFVGSMQAPFFPIEAEKKGATASQFSPIFGFIHLATVVTSPFMAKVITRVGLGNVFKLSLVLIFVAAISFGCLTYVDNLVLFLTLAYILRILAGVGGAALWTAMLSLLLARWKEITLFWFSSQSQSLFQLPKQFWQSLLPGGRHVRPRLHPGPRPRVLPLRGWRVHHTICRDSLSPDGELSRDVTS